MPGRLVLILFFWAAELGGPLTSVRSFRKGVSPEFTGIYIFRGDTFIRTYRFMALLAMLDVLRWKSSKCWKLSPPLIRIDSGGNDSELCSKRSQDTDYPD
jgi:hypothetical protein